MSVTVEQLEKAERLYREVLAESAQQRSGVSGDGDKMAYSLAKNAAVNLHRALHDLGYREDVRLRDETPSIMLEHKGIRNLLMVEKASHIRENVFTLDEAKMLGLPIGKDKHYHGLGEQLYLKIIDGLDNVKEAYRGTKSASDPARRENYFLLVSQFTDPNGDVVNVPVYINEHAQVNRDFIDVNKISTVYGKRNFREYITRMVRNGELVRIKKRNSQASEREAPIAPGYSSDVSDTNIPQPDTSVKGKNSTGGCGWVYGRGFGQKWRQFSKYVL